MKGLAEIKQQLIKGLWILMVHRAIFPGKRNAHNGAHGVSHERLVPKSKNLLLNGLACCAFKVFQTLWLPTVQARRQTLDSMSKGNINPRTITANQVKA